MLRETGFCCMNCAPSRRNQYIALTTSTCCWLFTKEITQHFYLLRLIIFFRRWMYWSQMSLFNFSAIKKFVHKHQWSASTKHRMKFPEILVHSCLWMKKKEEIFWVVQNEKTKRRRNRLLSMKKQSQHLEPKESLSEKRISARFEYFLTFFELTLILWIHFVFEKSLSICIRMKRWRSYLNAIIFVWNSCRLDSRMGSDRSIVSAVTSWSLNLLISEFNSSLNLSRIHSQAILRSRKHNTRESLINFQFSSFIFINGWWLRLKLRERSFPMFNFGWMERCFLNLLPTLLTHNGGFSIVSDINCPINVSARSMSSIVAP